MKEYDNGIATRKTILNVSKVLFYEQGFRETNLDDICRRAHVTRSAIQYHFKDKGNIRYEVLCEWGSAFWKLAQTYCGADCNYALSLYVFWERSLYDEKLRRFVLSYFQDYPTYSARSPLAASYRMVVKNIFSREWNLQDVSPLAFSSVYGYVFGIYQMMDFYRQSYGYGAKELFHHCITWGTVLWGIPKEEIDTFWERLELDIDKIPLDEIHSLPLF